LGLAYVLLTGFDDPVVEKEKRKKADFQLDGHDE